MSLNNGWVIGGNAYTNVPDGISMSDVNTAISAAVEPIILEPQEEDGAVLLNATWNAIHTALSDGKTVLSISGEIGDDSYILFPIAGVSAVTADETTTYHVFFADSSDFTATDPDDYPVLATL